MRNAVTHPAKREVKKIEELYGKAKGRRFEFEILAREGRKI